MERNDTLFGVDDVDANDSGPLKVLLDWARTYLCEDHPQLGRSGPVCPSFPRLLY